MGNTHSLSLLFNALGIFAVYALQRLQFWLPFNPQQMPNVSPDSAFNTAVSFATNTNWQGYGGETTMSLSHADVRPDGAKFPVGGHRHRGRHCPDCGFARHTAHSVGNAWVDLTRITLYVLLPLSLVFAVFLIGQGAIQNFAAYQDGLPWKSHANPGDGTVASQEAIKMIGTNGGGFFNANSAHPFENPTPLSNFFQMLTIFF